MKIALKYITGCVKKYFDFLIRTYLLEFFIVIFAFVSVLVFSLNVAKAFLFTFLILFFLILRRSASKAWLFSFFFFLLVPSFKISSSLILADVYLPLLAFFALALIYFKNIKLYFNNLGYFFISILVLTILMLCFVWFKGYFINKSLFFTSLNLMLFWLILSVFQYFFQTQKRIRQFLYLIVFVGVLHSIFGLFAFSFAWHGSGLGITRGQGMHLVFNKVSYSLSGFLGDGLVLGVGSSALAPFLLISISVSAGFLLIFFEDYINNSPSLLEFALIKKRGRKKKLKKEALFDKKRFLVLVFIMLIQLVAFVLTFSYLGIISLLLGFLIMAILLRKERVAYLLIALIVVFTVVFPSFNTSIIEQSNLNITQWFSGWQDFSKNWLWGNGVAVDKSVVLVKNSKIYNSYLYIWNTFGFFGFLLFLSTLLEYFREVYSLYRKSEGKKRVWLVVVLGIFVELLIFSLNSNTLIFGPAALVFWLLYAITMNLEKRKVLFGITETKLSWK